MEVEAPFLQVRTSSFPGEECHTCCLGLQKICRLGSKTHPSLWAEASFYVRGLVISTTFGKKTKNVVPKGPATARVISKKPKLVGRRDCRQSTGQFAFAVHLQIG